MVVVPRRQNAVWCDSQRFEILKVPNGLGDVPAQSVVLKTPGVPHHTTPASKQCDTMAIVNPSTTTSTNALCNPAPPLEIKREQMEVNVGATHNMVQPAGSRTQFCHSAVASIVPGVAATHW